MLTKEQIDSLYDFCKAKGAKYYDVQVELVDHLANGIEKEQAEHPDWSFQKALDVVFVSFGYPDFKPLVREKQKATRVYCQRLWWSLFKEQLRWPAIWAVWGLSLFIYYMMAKRDLDFSFHLYTTSGLVVLFVIFAGNYRMKGLEKRRGKRFLLTNLSELASLLAYYNVAFSYLNVGKSGHVTGWNILLFGTLNFAYFLVCLAYYRTVKRIEKQVKRDYPEVFTVA
jgi:hypothetical protein